MLKNAEYVSSLIVDTEGLSAKAQVGVDLTLKSINKINAMADNDAIKNIPIVYNDATATSIGIKNTFADYEEVVPVKENIIGSFVASEPEVEDPDADINAGDSSTQNVFELDPGVYSITFDQGITALPENNTAFIVHRSTLLRNGALITSAVYDPGFTVDNMGAVMIVHSPIRIEQHARVAQIIIHENEAATLYDGTYQGTKDIK